MTKYHYYRDRPKKTTGTTEKVITGCGNIYVTINYDDKGMCEVFATLGKSGCCATAQLEFGCRMISIALRSNVDPSVIVKKLRGIRCPSTAWQEGVQILSCADAIASVINKRILIDKSKEDENVATN